MESALATIRRYRDNDRPSVVRLIQRAFGYGPEAVNEEWWQWKHFQNPLGASIIRVAEGSGDIVGVHTLLRWPVLHEGRQMLAFQSTDSAVHPDWRRMGLFDAMVADAQEECRDMGAHLVFNHPTSLSISGFLKRGWRRNVPLRWLFKPVCPWATARRIVSLLLHPVQRIPPPAIWGGVEACSVLENEKALLRRFLDRLPSRPLCLSTARSADFYRWRYVAHPGKHYASLAYRRGGELAALAVVKIYRPGAYVCGIVAEFLALDADAGRNLAETMVERAADSGVDFLMVLEPRTGSAECEALRRIGFHGFPGGKTPLTTRSLTGGVPRGDMETFDMVAGDIIGI